MSSKGTRSLNPLRFAVPIGVMLVLVGAAARAGRRVLKHGVAVALLAGCAQAPDQAAGAGNTFDGTYKGSYLVVRGFFNPNFSGIGTSCLSKSDETVTIKNGHFDILWGFVPVSVDIAGDGTFRSEAHWDIAFTHPMGIVSIRGRIIGENLEADMGGGIGGAVKCAVHVSLKKT
jgi:hypothetical protein